MKTRLAAIAAVTAVLLGGLFAAPAAAANSTTTTTVFDGGTLQAWSGTEVYPATAYDTAVVAPDVISPAAGTLSYSFFTTGDCTGLAASAGTVILNADGTVPQSNGEGPLNAGTYSFNATYLGDGTNDASPASACEPFAVGRATPSSPTIGNIPGSAAYGGGFTASVTTTGDGTTSVTSNSTGVCTASGLAVTYVAAGTCSLTAHVAAGTNYGAANGSAQTFSVGQAGTTTPTISNIPGSAVYGGSGFTATVATNGDGTTSVTSNSTGVCTASGLAVTYVAAGTCSLTAHVAAGTNYGAADGSAQTFSVAHATPTSLTINNIPGSAVYGGSGFVASVTTNGDGTTSVISSTTSVCSVAGDGVTVTYVGAGLCTVTAHVAAGIDYAAANGSAQSFTVAQAMPAAPTITNLPASGTFGGGFTAILNTNGDGVRSVTSNTPAVCSTNGLAVSYVGAGTCSLNAQVAAGANYLAGAGAAQTFTVGRAAPTTPTITNVPSPAKEFFGFTAIVGTTGDGTTSVTSNTPNVCSVDANELTVTFVGFGTCSLTPSLAQGANYFGATGSPQTFTVQEASHGYWLVGSDGGIFSFGSAAFYGSTGGTPLQRPVMAITPTSTGNGYWLVASDGGIFSFGDSSYYGSLPGLGFHPAGSGLPQSLNAPIVGMVPTFTGHGYFMVASDGGVFAFGDAKFEGSCPGIGGCAGRAVAVMPDSTGNGYWLVTNVGAVYAFGDASFYGTPPANAVPVVGAVATSDGHGYWLLYANGVVSNFGDAVNYGTPVGYVNGFNPATTIFPTLDSRGYWVASARGDVFSYGDSPYLGSMAAAGLNGEIIGAFGF